MLVRILVWQVVIACLILAVWTCLHLTRFFLDLAVQVINWPFLANQLLQLSDILLIKFYFAFHIAQICTIPLKLTVSSSFQTLRLCSLSFDLLCVLLLFSFEFLTQLFVLVFDLCNSLLLHSILLLKLFLHFIGVEDVLTLGFLFDVGDSVLS